MDQAIERPCSFELEVKWQGKRDHQVINVNLGKQKVHEILEGEKNEREKKNNSQLKCILGAGFLYLFVFRDEIEIKPFRKRDGPSEEEGEDG